MRQFPSNAMCAAHSAVPLKQTITFFVPQSGPFPAARFGFVDVTPEVGSSVFSSHGFQPAVGQQNRSQKRAYEAFGFPPVPCK